MIKSKYLCRKLGLKDYLVWVCEANDVPLPEERTFIDGVGIHLYVESQLNPVEEVVEEVEVKSDPVPPAPADANPFPTDLQYDSLTVAELRDLCKERGLPVYGTKAEIVLRLKQNDEGIIPEEEPDSPTEEVALDGDSEAPTEEVAASNGEETNEEDLNGEQEPIVEEQTADEV
jgi:hypothetical protein